MAEGRDLDLAIMRLAWRLDALDRWRSEVEKELAVLSETVDELAEADRIAAAVAESIRKEPPDVGRAMTAGLNRWQRWGAFVGGALLLADAVKGLLPL